MQHISSSASPIVSELKSFNNFAVSFTHAETFSISSILIVKLRDKALDNWKNPFTDFVLTKVEGLRSGFPRIHWIFSELCNGSEEIEWMADQASWIICEGSDKRSAMKKLSLPIFSERSLIIWRPCKGASEKARFQACIGITAACIFWNGSRWHSPENPTEILAKHA
jgi:hypothetical protein